ncbi:MAG: helix-turn-helix domain-containing protein [Pseudomonadota bacterium]
MPTSSQPPLCDAELDAFEDSRDLASELLQAAREMKAGSVQLVYSPVLEARKNTGLSQSQFAALLGVSVATLLAWEQGRKQPSGAALTLLAIARNNPAALLAVAATEK